MSSVQTPTKSSPSKVSTPTAPKKARAKKEKAVVEEKEVKAKKVVKKKVAAKEAAPAPPVEEKKEEEEEEEVEKKARARSLPAKYNKFIQYTYYLFRAMNNAELEKNGEELLDEEKFFEAARVFTDMDSQQELVEGFLSNKSIGKEMRTYVADKKKAEKAAAKQKILNDKAAAKQKILDDKAAEKKRKADEKEAKKAAKNSKKKATKKGTEPDLVTSLVQMANSSPTTEPEVNPTSNQQDEEEEEELDVKVIQIDGKEYLIDENNNLYDSDSHAMIGSWNCVTKKITLV